MNRIIRRITGTIAIVGIFAIMLAAVAYIGVCIGSLVGDGSIPTSLEEVAYVFSLSDEDIMDELDAELARVKEINRRNQMYQLSYTYSQAGYVHKVKNKDIEDDALYSFEKSLYQYDDCYTYRTCNTESITTYSNGVTDDQINEYRFYISLLPDEFTNALVRDGYTITLFDAEDIIYAEDVPEGFTREGYTNLVDKEVCLNADNLKQCTIHELGHVLAYNYGLNEIIKDKDPGLFSDVCNNEAQEVYGHNAHNSLYIYLNPDEIIADFLYEYICYPRELEASAPVLYGCYEEALNNLK